MPKICCLVKLICTRYSRHQEMAVYMDFIAYPPNSHCYKKLLECAHKHNPLWKKVEDKEAIERFFDSFLPMNVDEQKGKKENDRWADLDNLVNFYDYFSQCKEGCEENTIASYDNYHDLFAQIDKQWYNKYGRREDFKGIPFQITAEVLEKLKHEEWPDLSPRSAKGMKLLTEDRKEELFNKLDKALEEQRIILFSSF